MKKIKYILLCLGVILVIAACKKTFLDTSPKDGSVTDASFFKTTAQFDAFMFGIYQDLVGGFNGQGIDAMIQMTAFMLQDGKGSDQLTKPLAQYMVPSGDFINMWTQFYRSITKVNTLLSKLPNAAIPDADKARLEGEALFLRGYNYLNVAAYFGKGPLLLKPYDVSQNSLPCTSRDSLLMQVIADLTKSATEIPTKAEWGSDNLGRATKGAAYGFLAFANMYAKNWAAAEAASNSLIALGTYQLLPTVRSVFSELNPNSVESIFETQNQNVKDGNLTWAGHEAGTTIEENTAPRNIGSQWALAGGWGELIVNRKLADSFEPGDERRAQLIKVPGEKYKGEQMKDTCLIPLDVAQSQSAFSTKYWLGPGSLPGVTYIAKINLPVMRYAEFLLNYAEILFMQGKTAQAYEQLNLIRKRAKLTDLPASADQATFMNALMNERRHELNFEPYLWSHYSRTGTLAAFLQSNYGYTWNPAWSLMPIPQSERDQNPHLSQNPGY